MIEPMLGLGVAHVILAFRANLIAARALEPAVAADGIFTSAIIAAAFDHVDAAGGFAALGAFVFTPLIAPIEGAIADVASR